MNVKINDSWKALLQDEFEKPYFKNLTDFLKEEYSQQTIYPPGNLIFNAFDRCPPENIKVVILGQDPYHGPGQANGLAFSVRDGITKPPSLLNIFKEIKNETGADIPQSGNLERWADQGVLLLNSVLTVRARQAGSHAKKGWETFTDSVIYKVSQHSEDVVFILWGAFAQKKEPLIDNTRHLILKSAHPSPFAADKGFFGNNHFVAANEYLEKNGKERIHF